MSATYVINGKPYRECDCDYNQNVCMRGRNRDLDTAGFRRCMVPADNVILGDGIALTLGSPATRESGCTPSSKSEKDTRNEALEEAARVCDRINSESGGGWETFAEAIRSLKSGGEDEKR